MKKSVLHILPFGLLSPRNKEAPNPENPEIPDLEPGGDQGIGFRVYIGFRVSGLGFSQTAQDHFSKLHRPKSLKAFGCRV